MTDMQKAALAALAIRTTVALVTTGALVVVPMVLLRAPAWATWGCSVLNFAVVMVALKGWP